MKLIGLMILFLSFSAFANNPQIRSCRLTGGNFQSLQIEADQVGFCVYGSSMIDSISVMQSAESGKVSQAIAEFNRSANSCEFAGGFEKQVQDLEGQGFQICTFDDHSAIEMQTMLKGADAPSNSLLTTALKVRY